MSEFAKKIGKAMFDHLVREDGAWCFCGGEAPDGVTLDGMFDLVELATAALEAMREPTEKMLDGVASHIDGRSTAEAIWDAMIEQALAP